MTEYTVSNVFNKPTPEYIVIVEQDGDTARIGCDTLEEAQQVKQSFVNYGKCSNVSIEKQQVEE